MRKHAPARSATIRAILCFSPALSLAAGNLDIAFSLQDPYLREWAITQLPGDPGPTSDYACGCSGGPPGAGACGCSGGTPGAGACAGLATLVASSLR